MADRNGGRPRVKLLRFILMLAVIGYAGWLARPCISPFFEGASP